MKEVGRASERNEHNNMGKLRQSETPEQPAGDPITPRSGYASLAAGAIPGRTVARVGIADNSGPTLLIT